MKKISLNTLSLFLKIFLVISLLVLFCVGWLLSQIPTDKEIRGCMTTKMYAVSLCPGSAKYTKLSNISDSLQKAVVLTEDSNFWNHQGFDLQEIQNSLKKNLEKGKMARGGSTITQQLAKNLFLTKDKTFTRKGIEALITIRIEKVLSKREILERYLNVVQFGKDIYGVQNAAQFYFKKNPGSLSVVESAFLAFLLPSPEAYSKSYYKKSLTPFARKRIHQIVDRMYQYNRIDEDQYLKGKADLEYFLTGHEAQVIDPALEAIDEEQIEQSLDEENEDF